MATNPWDIDGPLFPNFVKQAYKSGISGAAAQGLSYAPTDKEMLVMDLLILAIIVTAGAASAAAPAAGGAAAGGAAAGGAAAGGAAAGGAAAGGAATGGAAAGGAAAGGVAAGGAAAGGAIAGGTLSEVVVIGHAAATGVTIAQLAPLAVGLTGVGALTSLPQTLPYSPPRGSTTLQNVDSWGPEQTDSLDADLLDSPLGTTSANTHSPSVLNPASLGSTAIPGFFDNLFNRSSNQPWDRTEGAKFRPEMSQRQRTSIRNQRNSIRKESAKSSYRQRQSELGTRTAAESPLVSNIDNGLRQAGLTIGQAVARIGTHLPSFAARYPNLSNAAYKISRIPASLSSRPLTIEKAVSSLAVTVVSSPSISTGVMDNPWSSEFGADVALSNNISGDEYGIDEVESSQDPLNRLQYLVDPNPVDEFPPVKPRDVYALKQDMVDRLTAYAREYSLYHNYTTYSYFRTLAPPATKDALSDLAQLEKNLSIPGSDLPGLVIDVNLCIHLYCRLLSVLYTGSSTSWRTYKTEEPWGQRSTSLALTRKGNAKLIALAQPQVTITAESKTVRLTAGVSYDQIRLPGVRRKTPDENPILPNVSKEITKFLDSRPVDSSYLFGIGVAGGYHTIELIAKRTGKLSYEFIFMDNHMNDDKGGNTARTFKDPSQLDKFLKGFIGGAWNFYTRDQKSKEKRKAELLRPKNFMETEIYLIKPGR